MLPDDCISDVSELRSYDVTSALRRIAGEVYLAQTTQPGPAATSSNLLTQLAHSLTVSPLLSCRVLAGLAVDSNYKFPNTSWQLPCYLFRTRVLGECECSEGQDDRQPCPLLLLDSNTTAVLFLLPARLLVVSSYFTTPLVLCPGRENLPFLSIQIP